MKKYIAFIIIIIIASSIGSAIINSNRDHTIPYYEKLAMDQNLNSEVKFEKALDWFKPHVTEIRAYAEKRHGFIYVTYLFMDESKRIAKIEFKFKEGANEFLSLKLIMCINASVKTFYDAEAKRMLLMFLSSNDNFDYHRK